MLLRQHGSGHQHGYLLAAHDSLERGANGDFGFAEANIAADKTVHGAGSFHVALGVEDGAHLVRRFLEEKGVLELKLPGSVSRKGMSGL